MLIYSFQVQSVWNQLRETGYAFPNSLVINPTFDDPDQQFADAYAWLHRKMRSQNKDYLCDNRDMFWGWYQWCGKKYRPDLRSTSAKRFFDEPFVLLTLDLPDDRVLLSNYDTWHSVLNKWYLGHDHEMDQMWLARKKGAISEQDFLSLATKSWDAVLNLPRSIDMFGIEPHQVSVQATFHDICIGDVRRVEHFVGGKRISDCKMSR